MAILYFLAKPLSPEEDVEFSHWYSDIAERSNLSSDPDDPRHYYDYRSAYEAGARLDEGEHLPSKFKHDLHPDRYIIDKKTLEIHDSKYNEEAEFEDIIMQAFQRKEYEEKLFE